MSLEHLVPEEGKYSETKHYSPRRWEWRGGGGGGTAEPAEELPRASARAGSATEQSRTGSRPKT